MRIYDNRLGRFLSKDPISEKYAMLSTYQFASNTPLQAIDYDGLEAFYVHGTWSNPGTFSKFSKTIINKITSNTEGAEFSWTGNNSTFARIIAAHKLARHVMKHRDPTQPLTLVGHSHGGNVAIMATNILRRKGIVVNNLITFNTPAREYQLEKESSQKTNHVNIYHVGDPVQMGGGNSANIPDGVVTIPSPIAPIVIVTFGGTKKGTGEMGPAGQTFDSATNIKTPFDSQHVHDTHNNSAEWKTPLNEAINPQPMERIELPMIPNDATFVAPVHIPPIPLQQTDKKVP